MTTTYVERNNTNAEVFRRANEAIKHETPNGKTSKTVKPFVKYYLNSRMKRLARLHKMPTGHPVRHITLVLNIHGNCVPWIPPSRRVGRPRFNWVTEAVGDIWTNIRHEHPHIQQGFDKKTNQQQQHEAVINSINNCDSDPPFLLN